MSTKAENPLSTHYREQRRRVHAKRLRISMRTYVMVYGYDYDPKYDKGHDRV